MPRIRTIKPEFWTDPVMVRLSPIERLFYIGTWNFAICDQGHLEDDPLRLKLQILPAEDADVEAIIEALVACGRLSRVEVDSERYLHIRNLSDHQRVDGRWTPRCPVCAHQTSSELTGTRASSDETHRDSHKLTAVKESKGRESKGRVGAGAPLPRPEVAALCDLLADLVEGNGSKRPAVTQKWHDSARLLIDRDDRDPEEAARLIRWAQASDFWQANVLSMPKFREKYDTLRLQAERSGANQTNPLAHIKSVAEIRAERGF